MNRKRTIKLVSLVVLLITMCAPLACRTKPAMVRIAAVWYDGAKDGDEIIATLKRHHIKAVWQGEATVMFPILVPENRFDRAMEILQTNNLVKQGKVRLYPRTNDGK